MSQTTPNIIKTFPNILFSIQKQFFYSQQWAAFYYEPTMGFAKELIFLCCFCTLEVFSKIFVPAHFIGGNYIIILLFFVQSKFTDQIKCRRELWMVS